MRRTTFWRLGIASALVPAALLAAPASAGAATTPLSPAVFNDPSGTVDDQSRIRDYLLGLVNDTAPGAEIRVSMYGWTDDPVADALVAAAQRGVVVKVIVDDHTVGLDGTEYPRLANGENGTAGDDGLGTDRTKPSWVLACPPARGCIADREAGINHNKFFLFSQVNGVSNVLVQTSANLTTVQRNALFNNAVTLTDAGIYNSYKSYFADLEKYGVMANGITDYYRTLVSGTYKTYFFPRHEKSGTTATTDPSTDTIKLVLDNVSCSGGTQIRVAMYAWTRTQVASKLVSLQKAGCQVTLAFDGNDDPDGSPHLSAKVEDIISGQFAKRVECKEDPGGIGVHSKYLLIEGTYDGKADSKFVWTGSHNYTYGALRKNDEALLKINDPQIYAAFKANHDRLMEYCEGS
ncbi:phospholipase D-like domain-containing protein [Streptomyces odontomachi]|uniref:phospholipase D-like domain-containing protein n=1 Tax=Streptomyces odontomachi TaxID=2944940 RepID=UPI00210E72A9|nr:phospholipase D-like domain-containing protein [Streptomyces sp. ODS25]